VTTADEKTAGQLADGLVESRLAACVSVISGVASTYRWQGKIEKGREWLLVIKTRKNILNDVEQFVKARHSASTPEIVSLDISHGSKDYLNWLGANTLFSTNIPIDKQGGKTS
jgi:periplasmic divalent cation tolerance protein